MTTVTGDGEGKNLSFNYLEYFVIMNRFSPPSLPFTQGGYNEK